MDQRGRATVRIREWLWIIVFSGLGVGGAIPVLAQNSGHGHEGYEPAGRFPHSVVVGDFNKDGHLDMAIAASAERKITVLLGDGRGGVAANHSYEVGRGPVWVTAGDFDGDGHPDLVSANSGAGTVTLYLNDGRGRFVKRQELEGFQGPVAAVAADFDRDGRVDLAVADTLLSTVLVHRGDGK